MQPDAFGGTPLGPNLPALLGELGLSVARHSLDWLTRLPERTFLP